MVRQKLTADFPKRKGGKVGKKSKFARPNKKNCQHSFDEKKERNRKTEGRFSPIARKNRNVEDQKR